METEARKHDNGENPEEIHNSQIDQLFIVHNTKLRQQKNKKKEWRKVRTSPEKPRFKWIFRKTWVELFSYLTVYGD